MTPKQIAEDFLAANPGCSMLVMNGQVYDRHGHKQVKKIDRQPTKFPQFIRKHVPTGTESAGFFTSYHIEGISYLSDRVVRDQALELIDKWNHNLPGEWQYRFKEAA